LAIPFDSALAALAGSAIGGFTTLAVTWLTQGNQLRASLRTRDQTTRQKIYKQFIEEASKLYGDALVNSKVEIPTLVRAYALISRMRVMSSAEIVARADDALRTIVDIYFSPNKTMAELRAEINGGKLDLLREFSMAAKEELSRLQY
jgi:hypothetical protein